MSNNIPRWHQRFEHYVSALDSIEKVLPGFTELSELEQDGLIQRFEFTFDLSLKVMQDYLDFAGYTGIKGPRSCITQMAENGLVDGFVWEAVLSARNELTHVCDESKSRAHLNSIVSDFVPAFRDLKSQMMAKL